MPEIASEHKNAGGRVGGHHWISNLLGHIFILAAQHWGSKRESILKARLVLPDI